MPFLPTNQQCQSEIRACVRNSYKHYHCRPENSFCHNLQFSLPIFMSLFLQLSFQTFVVSLVKPMKIRSSMMVSPGFGFVNGSDGFTETAAKTCFGFDEWIRLLACIITHNVTYLPYCVSGSTITTVGRSQLLARWPGTHSRILSGIQRAAQTVLGVLKHTCLRDTSASSALGVLNEYALYKSTHSLKTCSIKSL